MEIRTPEPVTSTSPFIGSSPSTCVPSVPVAQSLTLLPRYRVVATKIRRWLAQFLDHVLLHGFWN
jgi:hypothetical protein